MLIHIAIILNIFIMKSLSFCGLIILMLSGCNPSSMSDNNQALPKNISIGFTYEVNFMFGTQKVKILEFQGAWTKVQFQNGEIKWVHNTIINAIDPNPVK